MTTSAAVRPLFCAIIFSFLILPAQAETSSLTARNLSDLGFAQSKSDIVRELKILRKFVKRDVRRQTLEQIRPVGELALELISLSITSASLERKEERDVKKALKMVSNFLKVKSTNSRGVFISRRRVAKRTLNRIIRSLR